MLNKIQGRKNIDGVHIVAGGLYGQYGDIIVDSIHQPSCVIGVSNGDGTVKYNLSQEEIEKIHKLERNFKVN